MVGCASCRGYVAIANNLFHPSFGKGRLGRGLEALQGFYQSLKVIQGDAQGRPGPPVLALNVGETVLSLYSVLSTGPNGPMLLLLTLVRD